MAKRRDSWTPPPRPEWVRRINEEGRYLDISGIVPLDENSLLATAKANTGLSDFGSDDWIEPFRLYVQSVDEDGALTLMGRIMTRSDLLMTLEERLKVEDTYKRHPEIAEEVIKEPLMIIGQGRSGTSFLINLLSLDPHARTLRTWEAMFPAPPPEPGHADNDPRIALADRRITQWERVTPEVASVHEFTGMVPTENIHVEAMSFRSPGWLDIYGQAPRYLAYMATADMRPAIRYTERVLKLLQWRNPRRRWMLKSPDCIRYMPAVLEVFPDLALVWCHRDPVVALSSMINLVGTFVYVRSDRTMSSGAFDQVTDPVKCGAMMAMPIRYIEQGLLDPARLYNIQYGDLVGDSIGTVEGIYKHFGIDFTPEARQAIQAYLNAHPRSARPAHRYALGDDESLSAERRAFAEYQRYFNVPSEV